MTNIGICKTCGVERPLMRSGVCGSCMRAAPSRAVENIPSRAVDEFKISEKLDTIIARVDVVYDKVDAIEGETSAFRELSIEAVEEEMNTDREEEEEEEESGPVGSSFYLVAAIVVCVVVGFLFRDKVLTFISGLKGQDTSGYVY